MAKKQKSNVDTWLERETKHNREALENASRYFDANDNKNTKQREPRKEYRCTEGHWVTIDDHPVFICD